MSDEQMPVWERRLREWPRDRIKPQGVAKCIDLMLADLAAAREREQRLDVFREFADASFAIEARYASGKNMTPEMQTQWDDLCDRVGKALAAAASSAVAQEPRGEGV